MLIDNVTLIVRAGDGGNGAATFKRDGMSAYGGPDGGNGGRGGDVYVVGNPNLTDLQLFRYKKSIHAQGGGHGTKHNGMGKNAQHLTIEVPLGTKITNNTDGTAIEIERVEKPVLLARGGRGGFGNVKFKSATNQAPKNRELGEPGEVKTLQFELRLIAEIGLIGLPNAGKSSLLAALTRANPKIGAYPFTTLEPNLGMFGTHAIADIPGLIEGASTGVGLGLKFLKHIEKTKLLIHCIDISQPEPFRAYETVRKEFEAFNPKLLEKPEIIFLNKTDIVDEATIERVKKQFSSKQCFAGSTQNLASMKDLGIMLSSALLVY